MICDSSVSYQQADIRVTTEDLLSGILPYTIHSGKCGVAGNGIQLPSDYLASSDEDIQGRPTTGLLKYLLIISQLNFQLLFLI